MQPIIDGKLKQEHIGCIFYAISKVPSSNNEENNSSSIFDINIY